ncbi:MAG: trypsin-like peptidase domain-containing protein [Bdellovibrionales bacterium]|nr:trypsin-like peptidase domain-containing protein [Bdellovibrionales bacterium]
MVYKSLLVLVCLFFTNFTYADNYSDSRGGQGEKPEEPKKEESIIAKINREKLIINEKAKRTSLQIFNEQYDPFEGGARISGSHGTGFIVEKTEDGHLIIFTNKHVVQIDRLIQVPSSSGFKTERAPDFIFRRLTVGKKYGKHNTTQKAAAEVLFISPIYDFAVIKVKESDLGEGADEFFQVAELVKTAEEFSQIALVSRAVLVYGYPHDTKEVGTQGGISALEQNVEGMNSVIQTDAPINGGNSGGQLIDMESGKTIGVNTWGQHNADGMGFAQPIHLVWEEWQRYLNNNQYGSRKKPFTTVMPDDRQLLEETGIFDLVDTYIPGFSQRHEEILMVQHTEKSSPFKAGDYLLRVDGKELNGTTEALDKFINLSEGKSVNIEVLRSEQLILLKVPIYNIEVKTEHFPEYLAFAGFVVRDLNYSEKEILGFTEGVVVGGSYHDPMSPVDEGFYGAVISEIQGPAGAQKVRNLNSLRKYLTQVPLLSFLQLRSFMPTNHAISTYDSEGMIFKTNLLSNVVTSRFSGFISSQEIPLEEFRKNFDYSGLNISRSNLGQVIQNHCSAALSEILDIQDGES